MGKDNCMKEPKKLYRIGVFAQINRVTVKTLRYYDDIGLLHPETVDEINGYRYYTSNQMQDLHKILALRDMGFSIADIKQIFNGMSEEKLLVKKKRELLFEAADISKKIASIESYLASETLHSDYRIIIKSLPEVTIASMHVHLKRYEDLAFRMPDMGLLMEKAGCECAEPEYCFTIYYDMEYKENDIDVEICEAVTQMKEDQGDLRFRTLPMVEQAACVLHKGSYRNLSKAYATIVQYIEESGYEIIGYQRESYIDGMWNKNDESEWLTEIQFPVRKIIS